MKKTYITPAMVIAMTATSNLCVTSVPVDNTGNNNIQGDAKQSSMWDSMESDDEEK